MSLQIQNLSRENSAAVRAAEILGREAEYPYVSVHSNHDFDRLCVKIKLPDGTKDENGRPIYNLAMEIPFPPDYHTAPDEFVLANFRYRIQVTAEAFLAELTAVLT